MKQYSSKIFLLMLFVSSFLIIRCNENSGTSGSSDTTCPITPSTNMVVYSGFGASLCSGPWTRAFLDWWKAADPRIDYTLLSASNMTTDCTLTSYPNLILYIQPGGNEYDQQLYLGNAGKNNIINFLNAGGHYMGTCAGFYYASSGTYWHGNYWEPPYYLGLIRPVEGCIQDIVPHGYYAITPMSNGNAMVYAGGPTYGYQYTAAGDAPGTIILTYTTPDSVNGLLAATMTSNMLLISPHPEADNYCLDVGHTLTDAQILANRRWLANQINTLLGTDFTIP